MRGDSVLLLSLDEGTLLWLGSMLVVMLLAFSVMVLLVGFVGLINQTNNALDLINLTN